MEKLYIYIIVVITIVITYYQRSVGCARSSVFYLLPNNDHGSHFIICYIILNLQSIPYFFKA